MGVPQINKSSKISPFYSYFRIETRGLGDHPVLRNPLMGLLGLS